VIAIAKEVFGALQHNQAHLNDSELNNPSMKMPTYVVNARSLPINHRVLKLLSILQAFNKA
jgi:hypothetical protein